MVTLARDNHPRLRSRRPLTWRSDLSAIVLHVLTLDVLIFSIILVIDNDFEAIKALGVVASAFVIIITFSSFFAAV